MASSSLMNIQKLTGQISGPIRVGYLHPALYETVVWPVTVK